MASAEKAPGAPVKILATHRKAFREYIILDRFEAGIELRGSEVKSIRAGRFSLNDGFAKIENGEVFLRGLHILPYQFSRADACDPARPKRLLMHRREIDRAFGQAAVKGQTLVPLKVYFKGPLVKVEMALCKGKQSQDKRESLRRKTADREAERAIASRTRRG
jgi:SsrA-binding protein